MTKDWVHGVGHSPVCQILLQIVVRAVITSSPPAWTSSAGMLSTPADFLYFSGCTAASTSLQRMGWSSSVSVWVQFSTDVVQLRAVFCPSCSNSIQQNANINFFQTHRTLWDSRKKVSLHAASATGGRQALHHSWTCRTPVCGTCANVYCRTANSKVDTITANL